MQIVTYNFTDSIQVVKLGNEWSWNITAPPNTTIISVGWQIIAGDDIGGLTATQCFVYNNGNNAYVCVCNDLFFGGNDYTVQVSVVLAYSSLNNIATNDFDVKVNQNKVINK